MKIASCHRDRRVDAETTMTPMIDVVFLLLIFFVCASLGQVRESLLATELAGGSIEQARAAPVERPVGEAWVRLTRAGGETRVELEGQVFDGDGRFTRLAAFLATLADAARELPVILDIDPDVPLGDMIRVYDACRAAEFDSIHFAIDPEREKSS